MGRDGFSLIEMLTACALLTAALGMIWTVWISAGDTAEVLGRKANATDDTVRAMAIMTRELRATSLAQLSPLPADEVTYRIPEDSDGNGLPVDANGLPEWGAPRRIGRDHNDANGDGLTETQLVLEQGGAVAVLANGLLPAEEPGVWFEARDGGVLVTVAVASHTRRKLPVAARAVQQITPRNP